MPDATSDARLGNYFEMVYADAPTFGKAPTISVSDAEQVDLAVYGIPWDQTATLRPGTRLGPRRIREQSLWFHEVWNPGETPLIPITSLGTERTRDRMRIGDLGDVTVVPTSREQTDENIRLTSTAVSRATFSLMLGGDHYVMFSNYAGFCDAHPDATVGIIQLDAHNDLIDNDAVLGSNWSGTPIRRAIEYSGVTPAAVAQIGLRGYVGAAESSFQEREGVFVATIDDVNSRGIDAVVDAACEQVLQHADLIYLTVDIDSVDPSCAPGTCTPVPGGLTSAQFIRILRLLGTRREIGALDLVEVSPPLDPSDQTTILASYGLFAFIEERFMREATS